MNKINMSQPTVQMYIHCTGTCISKAQILFNGKYLLTSSWGSWFFFLCENGKTFKDVNGT